MARRQGCFRLTKWAAVGYVGRVNALQQIVRILFVLLAGVSCFAADFLRAPPPKTKVSLLLSHSAARPGETITAALRLDSEPGWHTYWRNEGDAGIPTSIEWTLPPG